MARLTKHEQGQYVETFYGIHMETFEVESVSVTRGGTMTTMKSDGRVFTHHPLKGRRAKDEVTIVFKLTDVVAVPVGLDNGENAKRIREELQKKADEKKAAAGKA